MVTGATITLIRWLEISSSEEKKLYKPGTVGVIESYSISAIGKTCFYVRLEDQSQRILYDNDFTVLKTKEEE